jgi:hypothetical protein
VTLPASGNISMAQVLAELQIANAGRGYPISLTDTDVRTLAAVPSGSISLSNLYGKGAVNPIPITAVGDDRSAPTNPQGSISLSTDGFMTGAGNLTVAGSGWHTPTITGIGSGYWSRLVVNSGTNPNLGTGAVNTWQQLSSARSWGWNRTTTGSTVANCTLQIASDSGGSNIRASVTFNVTINRD